ncbi:alkane 1-monooxygenase [Fontimonas thermophila]|uniref:Alkane 1-monooxygenase n=2 Tax=Fontimonas thermophila TaxID=1076937 RepID=A0A1I2I8Z9_9GAMM|nr:alkane 1-monooxygenase [Fontimonas thermophila]
MSTPTLDAGTLAWNDGKRYLWLLSPFIPVLGLIGLGLFLYTDIGLFTWSGPLLIYGLIPLLDWLVGEDRNNPPEAAVAQLENDRYYRAIVYAYLPTQYAVTVLGTWVAVTADLAIWEYIGLVLSVGAVNGIGINTAHELGHKRENLDRWLAKLTLAPVAYGHFFVEHNRGHHKNVATPEDPASSKMGESFWAFLPRTVIGSLRSAWAIEKARLQRNKQSVWSLDNENLQAWAMTIVLFGALTACLGWPALLFLVLQAAYGASLLEVINYIEHYGLLRQKLPDGRYERCQPRHSWNSNHIVTNLFLYQLQRHSDHHANPTRRFQALRHFDDSPQLPSGYASMLIPAYVPWLWFRLMDPLVARHYGGDLTKANLYPPKRAALLARWHRPRPDARRADTQPTDATATPADAAASPGGRYQCTDCGYIYDEAIGCPREGFPPGTPWSQIPDDWSCPDCAVRDKVDFRKLPAA